MPLHIARRQGLAWQPLNPAAPRVLRYVRPHHRRRRVASLWLILLPIAVLLLVAIVNYRL